jgi:hypothetical protein
MSALCRTRRRTFEPPFLLGFHVRHFSSFLSSPSTGEERPDAGHRIASPIRSDPAGSRTCQMIFRGQATCRSIDIPAKPPFVVCGRGPPVAIDDSTMAKEHNSPQLTRTQTVDRLIRIAFRLRLHHGGHCLRKLPQRFEITGGNSRRRSLRAHAQLPRLAGLPLPRMLNVFVAA